MTSAPTLRFARFLTRRVGCLFLFEQLQTGQDRGLRWLFVLIQRKVMGRNSRCEHRAIDGASERKPVPAPRSN